MGRCPKPAKGTLSLWNPIIDTNKDADVCIGVLMLLYSVILPACFSIGRSNAKEAAISGVRLDNWESFANRLRREMPAGAPRWEK